jgi:DnaJ-domain-containing protein 1
MPFNITKTSDGSPFDLTDVIFKQLEELIKLEKAKKLGQGQGRGKKTLRKKYKKSIKHNKYNKYNKYITNRRFTRKLSNKKKQLK